MGTGIYALHAKALPKYRPVPCGISARHSFAQPERAGSLCSLGRKPAQGLETALFNLHASNPINQLSKGDFMQKRTQQSGQGMTEYILLVALIAIAAIVAVKYFGKTTSDSFKQAGNTIAGQVNTANSDARNNDKKSQVDQ
jgi:Flp pilus assembly pilin Flp